MVDDDDEALRKVGLGFSALGGAVGVPDLAAAGADGVITSPSPDRGRLNTTAATALPRCEDCDFNDGDSRGGIGVRGWWGRSVP